MQLVLAEGMETEPPRLRLQSALIGMDTEFPTTRGGGVLPTVTEKGAQEYDLTDIELKCFAGIYDGVWTFGSIRYLAAALGHGLKDLASAAALGRRTWPPLLATPEVDMAGAATAP
jgi:hypothetical protein